VSLILKIIFLESRMNIIGLDLTANDATPQFKLGTIAGNIGADGPQKLYKYVQYNAATAAVAGVAGEVAYYTTVAIGDATGTIVTSDVSDSILVGAGVLQADLTDDYYGWVQVSGPATLSIALDGSPADGNPLTPTGASDGTLDVVVTTVALANICAYSIDTSEKIIMCCFAH
jgi:hypothetical protein